MKEIYRWPVNSPRKKASNAENVSSWWRDHKFCQGFVEASENVVHVMTDNGVIIHYHHY